MDKKYMQGWRDAGWTILILVVACLILIWAGETYGQVQTQHLSVIAKKNSGSPPASDWVQVLIDTSFEDRTAFGSEWYCNAVRWTYDGTNNELDFDNTGAEGFHQDSIQVVNAGGTAWEINPGDSVKLQYGVANTTGSGIMFRVQLNRISGGIPTDNLTLFGYGQKTNGVYEHLNVVAAGGDGWDRLTFLALSGYQTGSFTWIKLWKKEN